MSESKDKIERKIVGGSAKEYQRLRKKERKQMRGKRGERGREERYRATLIEVHSVVEGTDFAGQIFFCNVCVCVCVCA